MPTADNASRIDELLAKVEKLSEESKIAQEHTTELIRLNDELESEQRKNATFLLDKCLPVLTAIVGGIAYVLMENKFHSTWQINCFRIAGSCLTLAILILLARAWLDPFFAYHFKEQLLAMKFRRPQPFQPWIIKKLTAWEDYRILLTLILLVVGLFLAGVATMLN